jgi:spore coat protein CotF
VFDSKLVNEFINKKFKLDDFIGLCFNESTATNSKTNEQFIKRRVSDTFVVHETLNLSKLAWRKYAQRSKQSDKVK